MEELVTQARANRALPRARTVEDIERQLRNVLGGLLLGNDYDVNPDAPVAYLCRHLAAIISEIEDLRQPSRH